MEMITVAFSSTKSKFMLFGKLIEAIEKRPFSHSLVIYKDSLTGMEMVFQASHGRVNCCSLDRFLQDNVIKVKYNILISDELHLKFSKFKNSMLGAKYSWAEIFFIAIKKLIHLESPFKDGLDTVICSELAAYVCQMLGIEMPKNLDSITPSELNSILSSYYAK